MNNLKRTRLCGVHAAHTGYTGEPLSYETYIRNEEAVWLWNRLIELGAKPAGLGARDTRRLKAAVCARHMKVEVPYVRSVL